ncbi:glycosyltransferase [Polaribacter aestuariivivens]|uniref:glycosyltransferase n=1 Tax=Polaribacter aestuariivivens TaxID=2304626 RepID=UPI003F494F85
MQKRIGVLQLIDSLNTGGAEVMAVNIANELYSQGFKSHLCATRLEGLLKNNIDNNVGYLFLKKNKKLDILAINKLKKYLINNDISIIHAHSTSYFTAFLVKIIYPKVKIVWHDHFGKSQNLNKRKLYPLKISSFFFNSIISVNNILKDWSKKNLMCKNVYFINNFAVLNNNDKVTELKNKKSFKIIHLAGFRKQKDHETLIKGFEIFSRTNKKWTLHLIGGYTENSYTKKIKKLIIDKKLIDKVFIYGACLDVFHILKQGNIGVLSSKSEGLPVSLIEYGLANLPVIVTNVGECGKVVENNISGFVIEPENISQLSNKLDILANSFKLRNTFKSNHNKKILSIYSKKIFIQKLLKIYQNICD